MGHNYKPRFKRESNKLNRYSNKEITMKHIKKFSEAKSWIKKEEEQGIEEFCQSYLASILDTNWYTISYIGSKRDNLVEITINSNGKQALRWRDFKIDFLPFLEMLMKEYKVVSSGHKLGRAIVNVNGLELTMDEIMDDEFEPIKPGEWGGYAEKVKIRVRL